MSLVATTLSTELIKHEALGLIGKLIFGLDARLLTLMPPMYFVWWRLGLWILPNDLFVA